MFDSDKNGGQNMRVSNPVNRVYTDPDIFCQYPHFIPVIICYGASSFDRDGGGDGEEEFDSSTEYTGAHARYEGIGRRQSPGWTGRPRPRHGGSISSVGRDSVGDPGCGTERMVSQGNSLSLEAGRRGGRVSRAEPLSDPISPQSRCPVKQG